MKQKLLTDIELDVHELKFLMDTFSKEPTQTLSELLKRSILRMQDRLEQLSEEIEAVPVEDSPSAIAEGESSTGTASISSDNCSKRSCIRRMLRFNSSDKV